jgi:hypothetical protein
MPSSLRILHLLDSSTPGDSLDMLAHLVAAPQPAAEYRVMAMGHRSTGVFAEFAGLARDSLVWAPSLGWADPAGWRAVRRLVARFEPTHIHAWGLAAVVAVAASGSSAKRLATFTTAPSRTVIRGLRIVEKRESKSPWTWVAASSSIRRILVEGGVRPERVIRIRPGVGFGGGGDIRGVSGKAPIADSQALKEELGIEAADGPILLLGGEGKSARHDFGLWAAAILQQMFPRTRAIVREDPRGAADPGLDRFSDSLPEARTIVAAPPEMHWRQLATIADILLITPDHATATGSILYAMAAGVPVIGTPVECVGELIEHGHNGLLAKTVKPRAIAARLEEFMNDSTLKRPLTDRARANLYAHFEPSAMVETFARVYGRDAGGETVRTAS